MKSTYKKFSVLAIGLAFAGIAGAQTLQSAPTYSDAGSGESKVKVNLLYNYSLPMGSFKNDVFKNNSARGFNADILYWMNEKWGVGAGFGYQDYYQKNDRQVYKLSDGSDISAVLSHSMQVIPIMAKANFAPYGGNGSMVQPYVSLGAGANIVRFGEYLGEFSSLSNTSATFGAEAGAGVKFALGKSQKAGFMLGANYRFSPYNNYDIKNLNTLNLQAGFQFRLSK